MAYQSSDIPVHHKHRCYVARVLDIVSEDVTDQAHGPPARLFVLGSSTVKNTADRVVTFF